MFSRAATYLEEGEELQESVRPSRFDTNYLHAYALGLVLLLVAGGAYALGVDRSISFRFPVFTLALLLAAAGVLLVTEVRRRFVLYHVTDRKLIKESGIIDRTVETVHFDSITETTVAEELEERVFNVGDIGVNTAGTDTTELVLNGVSHPERYKVLIDEHVSRYRTEGADKEQDRDPDTATAMTPAQLESRLFRVREQKRELTERYRRGDLSEPRYREQWYALDGKERLLDDLLS